jgi:uncharacterized membrane protein YukC
MIKVLIAILKLLGLSRWAAALEGGSQAYQNQAVKETDLAQAKLQELVDHINQEVADAQKEAHAAVVAADDPDRVAEQQLLDIYACTGEESAAGKTD